MFFPYKAIPDLMVSSSPCLDEVSLLDSSLPVPYNRIFCEMEMFCIYAVLYTTYG